jgi:hypothetical protein
MSRTTRLYSSWHETKRLTLIARATCSASAMRQADIAHLALPDQVVQRPQGLLDRRQRIVIVLLV